MKKLINRAIATAKKLDKHEFYTVALLVTFYLIILVVYFVIFFQTNHSDSLNDISQNLDHLHQIQQEQLRVIGHINDSIDQINNHVDQIIEKIAPPVDFQETE